MLGKKAHNFLLKDKEGKSYSLNDFGSKYKVIYFYPRDNTPGCTIEAKMFDRDLDEFKKLDTEIIGISGGDEKTKTKFCEKHKLRLLLLSDTDFSVSKSYEVYGEKSFMGRKFLGIKRTTFILNKDNEIIKVFEKVNPAKHSKEVLEFIKDM